MAHFLLTGDISQLTNADWVLIFGAILIIGTIAVFTFEKAWHKIFG